MCLAVGWLVFLIATLLQWLLKSHDEFGLEQSAFGKGEALADPLDHGLYLSCYFAQHVVVLV